MVCWGVMGGPGLTGVEGGVRVLNWHSFPAAHLYPPAPSVSQLCMLRFFWCTEHQTVPEAGLECSLLGRWLVGRLQDVPVGATGAGSGAVGALQFEVELCDAPEVAVGVGLKAAHAAARLPPRLVPTALRLRCLSAVSGRGGSSSMGELVAHPWVRLSASLQAAVCSLPSRQFGQQLVYPSWSDQAGYLLQPSVRHHGVYLTLGSRIMPVRGTMVCALIGGLGSSSSFLISGTIVWGWSVPTWGS